MAKAIVTALDLPPESADARKLINWKVPTKEDVSLRLIYSAVYTADLVGTPSCRKQLVNSRKFSSFSLKSRTFPLTSHFLLSTVAEKVIMSRSSVVTKYGKLSVEDVNNVLDEISKTVPTMGADGKKKMPSYVSASLTQM